MQYKLHLDWLSFTFKPDIYSVSREKMPLDLFLDAFPEFENVVSDMVFRGKGLNCYNSSFKYNDDFIICTNIILDDEPITDNIINMGVHVICPSHSLELLYNLMNIDIDSEFAIPDMLTALMARGCVISRIDLAFDDYVKKYTAYDYCQFWMNRRIRTRFQKCRMITCSKESSSGSTFYLGSRSTGKMLRIYDKDKESNGELDCIRYEIEVHGNYAKDLALTLIRDKHLIFTKYLKNDWFVVLVENNNLTNKSNVSIDAVWDAYMNETEISRKDGAITVPRYTAKQRVREVDRWIEHTVLNTLNGYVKVHGVKYLLKQLDLSSDSEKYKMLCKSLDLVWDTKYTAILDE